MKIASKSVAVICLVAAQTAVLQATDGTWNSPSDGTWSGGANWQDGTVASGAGSVAYLPDLGGAVAVNNDVTGLKLKGVVAQGGAYSLLGLPLTLEGTASGNYGLIVQNGTLTLNNALTLNAGTQFNVAEGAALTTSGTLAYSGNRTLNKRGGGEWIFSGTLGITNDSAYLDIVGGTLRLVPGARLTKRGGDRQCLRVGSTTPGRVVVENGAALNVAAFLLGEGVSSATNGNGTLLVNGGTLTANSTLDQGVLIGRYAASVLSVSNNAMVDVTGWLSLGAWARGELHIGGHSTVTAGQFALGVIMYEENSLNGGSLVKIGGGGLLSVTNLFAWRSSGSEPRTNLVFLGDGTAGSATLRLPATCKSANNTSFARLTVDGGSLELSGVRDTNNGESLTNYLYGLSQFRVGRAGAVIDTTDQHVTVTQALERDPAVARDGGLVKRGAGSLTLAGGAAYNGHTLVEQGTLRLGGGTLPTNVTVVVQGATLSLADGQLRAFAPSRLTIGNGGASGVELEAGPDGACDSLTLPTGAPTGEVVFTLVGLNGASSWWLPGDYTVATYAGVAPDIGGWSASTPAGVTATFEVQPALKRVVLHVTSAGGASAWLKAGSGAWADAANWNVVPASDPSATVLFGSAPGAAVTVNVGAPVTVGSMTFDAAQPYTLAGSGITFGALDVPGTLNVAKGGHTVHATLALPSDLAVNIASGASLLAGGGASGAGRLAVTGGGTLEVANGALIDVPLTVDGASLAATATTGIDTALTVGVGGATVIPAAGTTLTLAGTLEGPGALAKEGASVLVLSGADSGIGLREIRNGTLSLASLAGGDFLIGEGRLTYTGASATFDKGLTVRTKDDTRGGTFDTTADVTLNGNVTVENGVFIKTGVGTLTLAGSGVNVLGAGMGSFYNSAVMNFGATGESPTQGLRSLNIVNGTIALGAPGQINTVMQTIIVGGESTTAAGAETAGHLVINGGVFSTLATLTVGRGNGTAVTAPGGLESSVRINDGKVSLNGLWLAAKVSDQTSTSLTAKPLFEVNGGDVSTTTLYGGNDGGAPHPQFVFNGGVTRVTGTASDAVRLAIGSGVQSKMTVNGGLVTVSNTTIRLAENHSSNRGQLVLNGGRLITRGITRQGAGIGEVYFNGGALQPCLSMTLTNLSAAAVRAGGFVADVPTGLTLTVMQPLAHDDDTLGTAPDGGVVKTGAGTLVLGTANTYTGPTVVSGGVLRVTGPLATSGVVLEDGTALVLADGACSAFAPPVAADGRASVDLDIAADGSANDTVALAAGFAGTVRVRLTSLETGLPFAKPGRYVLFTFSGAAPDTAGWTVEGVPAGFEVTGSTVDVVIGATGGSSDFAEWVNTAGGVWDNVANWSETPGTNVLFGTAVTAPAVIDTGSGASFGYMVVDNANGYTWNGGALTAGDAVVARGMHTIEATLNLPSASVVNVAPGASLNVFGAVSGVGSLTVAGGGTVALTNGPAVSVPVTLDGATLATTLPTVFDAPFTLGTSGAVVTSAYGTAVTLTAPVTGPGGLVKHGSSVLTLTPAFGGELWVRRGTVESATEPAGALVLGEGTFRHTGPATTFTRGYVLRTTTNSQAASFESDADVTINGQVTSESGAFIKWGTGTLTYGYIGENWLSAGDNSVGGANGMVDRPAYGDSPAGGYRSYNVFNGKVVLGAPGQTNRFSQAVVVGGASTTQAGAETAGHMEVNGGTMLCEDYITIGRGNGTAVTAPNGLESTFTLNDGEVIIAPGKGVWLGAKLADQATLTAKPRLIIHGGSLSASLFYCGNGGGTVRPKIEVNGGTMTLGPNDATRLARAAGCETEFTINGGTVCVTNQMLNLAENIAGAKGTLNLNGGRLIARRIYKDGLGVGEVNFNGGVFEPSQNGNTFADLSANVLAGGAVFDVPAGVTHTAAAPLKGIGGVTKMGGGVLVLAASGNTYAGATVVSGGVLRITGGGTLQSSVTVAVGGTLSFQVPVSGQTVGGITLVAGGSLYLNASEAAYATGVVHVAGDLVLGAGSVGMWPDTLPNGTYTLLTCGGTISGDPAGLSIMNGRFGKAYTLSVVDNALRLTIGTAASGAAVWTSAAGGDWADAANWAAAPGVGTAGLTVGFTEAIAAPAAVNVAGAVTAGELLFDNANAYTLTGAGSLTLATTNDAPATVTVRQGAHTVALPVDIGGGLTAAVNGELRITGAISGEGKLVKSGAGRLKLTGANTYSGGTEIVGDGVTDVTGASPFGTGPVTIGKGGGVAAKDAPAVIANDVSVGGMTYLGAYAPLMLAGNWTLRDGNTILCKVAADEVVVAGALKPSAAGTNQLEIRNGTVRFAAGADALFRSGSVRESITFQTIEGTPPMRTLTVEAGAQVEAQCLFLGNGRTNDLVVTGGELRLTGNGANNDALVFGVGNGTVHRLRVSGGTLWAGDGTWSLLGVNYGPRDIEVGGGAVSLAKVSLGVRDEMSATSGPQAHPVTLRLAGGLLEARESWNWLADRNGARLNEIRLDGGRLRLPATYATVTDRLNVSRLVFNGGTLETAGGGITAEDPADYLKGLKTVAVAAGGATIDTQRRGVTLAQRLVGAGDVLKRGLGTLTLAKLPCVNGRVDVQTGTLRQLPEAGLPYPDDPIVRLTFDGTELQTDASVYTNAIGLVGSAGTLTAVDGVRGYAARLAHLNALAVPYRDDHPNADNWTVSVWVRQSTRGTNNQRMTFFGTLDDYIKDAQDFLLRVLADGTFRWLGTGAGSVNYGQLYADVADAVPLNTWTMLTFVADGLNGFSMYVNGERRTMSVTANSGSSFVSTDVYGAGQKWLLVDKTGGRAFTIGAVADSDTDCFEGDIDEATVYRRTLSAEEIALLYRGQNPYPGRVRVAAGAVYDLAGAEQEIGELTGEGMVANGTAKVTGRLAPGDDEDAPAGAWLTATGGLTFGTNATYRCDWTSGANDFVDVQGTLTVSGAGVIDLGLTEAEQMPASPHNKRFTIMAYGAVEGAANFAGWTVTGTGRHYRSSVTAQNGEVTVTLEGPGGTLVLLK